MDADECTLLLLVGALPAEALSQLEAIEDVGLALRTSEDVGALETARELWLSSADEMIELLALALARPPLFVADGAEEAGIEALSMDALWDAATLEEAWALALELAISLTEALTELAEDTATDEVPLSAAEVEIAVD